MTDEERADEYASSYGDDNIIDFGDDHLNLFPLRRWSFLDGLKAGKDMKVPIKWHDLRKDPTDVPKENVTVLLLTEVEPVTARYDNEYEAFFRYGDKLDYCVFIAPMSYIAWCEIPKFEEK